MAKVQHMRLAVSRYNILNGLLFISGLRGLIGRAKRSSSTSSAAGVGRGAVLPIMASREPIPPPLLLTVSLEVCRPCGNMDPKDDTATSDAPGESEVKCPCCGRGAALFAASGDR